MNNITLSSKLAPRLMSLAISVVRESESKGHSVRLEVSGKERFRLVSLNQGRPVTASDAVEKIVLGEVGKRPQWYKMGEGGWVVPIKEEKPAEKPADNTVTADENKGKQKNKLSDKSE